MRVRDLMAVDVIVIPVSATVTEATEILRHGRVSGAPVIDRAGSPVGIFSVKDVAFGWGQEEAERQRLAAEAAAKQRQAEEERKAQEAALAQKQRQVEEERKVQEAALAQKQRQAEEVERLAHNRKVASLDSASEANEASSKSCNKAKLIISKYGFEDIQTKSCNGKIYHFSATREGKKFSVKINALTSALTEIKKVKSYAPE